MQSYAIKPFICKRNLLAELPEPGDNPPKPPPPPPKPIDDPPKPPGRPPKPIDDPLP